MIIHVTAAPELNALLTLVIIIPELLVPPAVESISQGLALGHQLLTGSALPHLVLGVELVAVLLQVLLDLLTLFFAQQRLWPWSPNQLAELLNRRPLEDLSLEVPEPVGIVHLVAPPADPGHDIPASGIPLNIRAHEVLATTHGGEVRGVNKLKNSIHAPEPTKDTELSGGGPEDVVGCLP